MHLSSVRDHLWKSNENICFGNRFILCSPISGRLMCIDWPSPTQRFHLICNRWCRLKMSGCYCPLHQPLSTIQKKKKTCQTEWTEYFYISRHLLSPQQQSFQHPKTFPSDSCASRCRIVTAMSSEEEIIVHKLSKRKDRQWKRIQFVNLLGRYGPAPFDKTRKCVRNRN